MWSRIKLYDWEVVFLLEIYEDYQKNVICRWQNAAVEQELLTEDAEAIQEIKQQDEDYKTF